MNCVAALSDAIASIALACAAGSFIAGWFGAVMGRMAYDWMFAFIRRTTRWRRFDRAMRKFFA